MPTIRIAPFGGMRPAISSPLREARYGDYVCDAKLLTGSLKPLRAPLNIGDDKDYKSIAYYPKTQNGKKCGVELRCDCAWVFPDNTSMCSGFDTAVVFYHRCENKPAERIDLNTCEVCPLCIEAPTTALEIEVLDEGTIEECDLRIYTYTFVDKFGIETKPAPASDCVSLGDDGRIRLTNFDAIPNGAVSIRIYRTSSPFDTGESANTTNETTFQMVEEISVDGFPAFYIDDFRLCDICMGTLDTMEQCCPPEFCQVVKTRSGYYVGFVDNRIYVSGRHQPYNFPLANMVELPDMIMGIAAHRDTILIGTVGTPYRLPIAAATEGDVIDPEPFPEHFPMLNQTMVETPWGAMYASDTGLVGLFPNRNPVLLSRERITEDQWIKYIPCTAAWYRGRYYGFREDGKSFVFDVAEGGESRLEIGDFTLLSFNARYAMTTPDGNMYLINDEGAWDWENGTEFLDYEWKSKRFVIHPPASMSAANIIGSGTVKMKLWADGCKVVDCEIDTCRAFRLGGLPKAREWCIEICGTGCVDEILIGSSIGDISLARN